MKRAAVFFDRDNTLIVSDGYLGDPAQVKLIDGAAGVVARAHALGFVVVTISNQSGVAKGLFPEEAVHAVNVRLDELLRQADPQATIDRHEFCPFHPEAVVERYKLDSDLRKPKPGMLIRAAKMLDLDLAQSWVIGDAPRDMEAGKAAGCRTILFQPPDIAPSPAAEAEMTAPPDATFPTLSEALDYIAAETPPLASVSPAPIERPPAPVAPEVPRLERIAEQILHELRRRNNHGSMDFSVSKLLAGVSQAIALAALIGAYFLRDRTMVEPCLLVALTLQTLTLTLLAMGREH